MGRQNLSPSPRNSANSSRRGSNSNIPASVASAAMSQRDSSSQSRDEIENARNGVPGAAESIGASSGEINERPPIDTKMRDLVENKCKHIYSEYSAHREFDVSQFLFLSSNSLGLQLIYSKESHIRFLCFDFLDSEGFKMKAKIK